MNGKRTGRFLDHDVWHFVDCFRLKWGMSWLSHRSQFLDPNLWGIGYVCSFNASPWIVVLTESGVSITASSWWSWLVGKLMVLLGWCGLRCRSRRGISSFHQMFRFALLYRTDFALVLYTCLLIGGRLLKPSNEQIESKMYCSVESLNRAKFQPVPVLEKSDVFLHDYGWGFEVILQGRAFYLKHFNMFSSVIFGRSLYICGVIFGPKSVEIELYHCVIAYAILKWEVVT